jgi:CYTH domain-containing protein
MMMMMMMMMMMTKHKFSVRAEGKIFNVKPDGI